MTKKNLFLILFTVALATVYVIWFTDWFRPKTVKIFHTSRALRASVRRRAEMPNLSFGFNDSVKLQLTELKVVPLAEYQTNKNALPAWHLVSDSNSVPLCLFTYGQYIRGMRPMFKSDHAEPLETNVTYRLLVTAGKITGEHDFVLK